MVSSVSPMLACDKSLTWGRLSLRACGALRSVEIGAMEILGQSEHAIVLRFHGDREMQMDDVHLSSTMFSGSEHAAALPDRPSVYAIFRCKRAGSRYAPYKGAMMDVSGWTLATLSGAAHGAMMVGATVVAPCQIERSPPTVECPAGQKSEETIIRRVASASSAKYIKSVDGVEYDTNTPQWFEIVF